MYLYSITMTVRNTKNKMFISQQTYENLKISVSVAIEPVQFLLQYKVGYVLTERFSQYQLENYVGERIILPYVTSDITMVQFEIRDFFDQWLVMLGVLMKQTLSLSRSQFHVRKNQKQLKRFSAVHVLYRSIQHSNTDIK